MKTLLSIFTVLVLAGGGCMSTPPKPVPQPAPQEPGPLDPYLMPAAKFGQEITLEKDESRVYEDGLTIGLVAIEDSRCAKDVVCIWAGELAYLLGVTMNGSVIPKDWKNQVRLGTTTAKEVEANGYLFTLVDGTEAKVTLKVTKK